MTVTNGKVKSTRGFVFVVNTPLTCYRFPYVIADLHYQVLSQTPAHIARPRIQAIVFHAMCLKLPQLSLYSSCLPSTHEGMSQAE